MRMGFGFQRKARMQRDQELKVSIFERLLKKNYNELADGLDAWEKIKLSLLPKEETKQESASEVQDVQ